MPSNSAVLSGTGESIHSKQGEIRKKDGPSCVRRVEDGIRSYTPELAGQRLSYMDLPVGDQARRRVSTAGVHGHMTHHSLQSVLPEDDDP